MSGEGETLSDVTLFDVTLFDVAPTIQGLDADGSGGTLVADRGDGLEVIFDDGPSTRNNQMLQSDKQRKLEES